MVRIFSVRRKLSQNPPFFLGIRALGRDIILSNTESFADIPLGAHAVENVLKV